MKSLKQGAQTMRGLFGDEGPELDHEESASAKWSTIVLGFIGGAVICWILLRALAPWLVETWHLDWINKIWARIGITTAFALALAVVLWKIEGTIWGRYYVIIGYLLSFALIVWIVLRLLRYV
jgi:hypothetical protein